MKGGKLRSVVEWLFFCLIPSITDQNNRAAWTLVPNKHTDQITITHR